LPDLLRRLTLPLVGDVLVDVHLGHSIVVFGSRSVVMPARGSGVPNPFARTPRPDLKRLRRLHGSRYTSLVPRRHFRIRLHIHVGDKHSLALSRQPPSKGVPQGPRPDMVARE
jgi:hypothetical protein